MQYPFSIHDNRRQRALIEKGNFFKFIYLRDRQGEVKGGRERERELFQTPN